MGWDNWKVMKNNPRDNKVHNGGYYAYLTIHKEFYYAVY